MVSGHLIGASAAAHAAVPAAARVALLAAGNWQDTGGAGAAAADSAYEQAGAPAWAPAACFFTHRQGTF